MSQLSIRITHREGGVERSIDVDTYPTNAPPILSFDSNALLDQTPKRFSAADGMVHDARTGLTWSQDDATEKTVSWKKADEACKALRLGGFDDWRMPTREEQLTLVDDTRYNPAIDTSAFPSCKSEWYWTGTAYAASPSDCAWGVGFSYGYSYGYDRDGDARVRAVRGPSRQ